MFEKKKLEEKNPLTDQKNENENQQLFRLDPS
jgi:hypothetical protein